MDRRYFGQSKDATRRVLGCRSSFLGAAQLVSLLPPLLRTFFDFATGRSERVTRAETSSIFRAELPPNACPLGRADIHLQARADRHVHEWPARYRSSRTFPRCSPSFPGQ